ncbi:hypothetical protein [Tamlana flava]|uniref:hypothetical protein n=1 Tax=Tamlana flava TaxID=3158572 RepID=UPI00351B3A53
MIKFFSKIRHNLIKQNKIGKYFKYAIGEILLVVIGILIALNINNSNEKRKNHMFLTSNLQGVLEELKIDSTIIDKRRIELNKRNENRIAFINHTNYEWFTRDSLEQSIENYVKELSIEYSYYQKIRNSNITEYGVYSGIMEDIIVYYDFILPFLKKITVHFDQQVEREDEFWRYEQKTYEFNYVEGLSSFQNNEVAKKEIIELINSVTARNIMKIDVRRNNYMLENLEGAQNYLKEMILNLDKVLQ